MSSLSSLSTFYRRITVSQCLRQQAFSRPATSRAFCIHAARRAGSGINSDAKMPSGDTSNSTTGSGVKTDAMPDDQHATNKKDQLDVQSSSSGAGQEARSQDTGGSATQASDTRGSTAQAKKDYPEAPDTVIGMQDERGGKGH